MRARNVVPLLSILFLSYGLIHNVHALPAVNSVSFHGVGVTIDLAYPEEAHPAESITHNVSITANSDLTLQNFTLFVYAPVNSTLQQIKNQTIISWDLLRNENLTSSLRFTLPQNANGTLYCFLYVQTDQSADYSSFTFYTTQVRTLTYSELLSAHNELIANYTALSGAYDQLNASYSTLLLSHNELTANYNTLLADYGTLLGTYNTLLTEYNTLNSAYSTLTSDHETLNSTYNSLLTNYNNLNASFTSLLAQNTALQSNYSSLNSTYLSLQANYSSLQTNYNSLNTQNNALQSDYSSLDSTHNNLQTLYNSLFSTKNTLQSDYTSLNSTRYSIQASYDSLNLVYAALNQTVTALDTEINDLTEKINISESAASNSRTFVFIALMAVVGLIALVIYLKKKEPEPYVVIRKETVAVNPEETQKPE